MAIGDQGVVADRAISVVLIHAFLLPDPDFVNGGPTPGKRTAAMAIAILDIDGTLVDTNYHHAIAWFRAFRQHGIVLPIWRIHRHIGMGGDQLIGALTDERFEEREGDSIRDAEKVLYMELIGEVEPMQGARQLLEEIKRRGHSVVLASSAKADEVEHYVELLDARTIADAWTTSADVEQTKPQPDLVNSALQKAQADAKDAVMVGDTPWDVQAAKSAKVPTIAVRTGGFGQDELEEAGAAAVFESVAELLERIDETKLKLGSARRQRDRSVSVISALSTPTPSMSAAV